MTAVVDNGPLLFRLADQMIGRRIRGGYRLMHTLERRGMLNCLARYDANGIPLHVPLWRPETRYSRSTALNYERALVETVASRITRPSLLIDCGAEIGLFSTLLYARSTLISRIVAVEPNLRCISVLKTNLASLPINTEIIEAAIGGEPGRGSLCQSELNPLEYALYMQPNADGNIRICTIDEIAGTDPAPVVIKLDVEGSEGEAIRGAINVLSMRDFVLAIEANWPVYQRTKVDPIEVLRLVPYVERCELIIAELPGRTVDLSQSFIRQFPDIMRRTLNVVVTRQ